MGNVRADGAVQNKDMLVSKAMRHSCGALKGKVGNAAGDEKRKMKMGGAIAVKSVVSHPHQVTMEVRHLHPHLQTHRRRGGPRESIRRGRQTLTWPAGPARGNVKGLGKPGHGWHQ